MILSTFYISIQSFFSERKIDKFFWLHGSVFLYIALLPFNAFRFSIPFLDYSVKYTHLAFFTVLICFISAYAKGLLVIRKAWWLYGFLLLQAVIQFISLLNAPEPMQGLRVAIAVAQYSLLVFVLVNAVRTKEALQRVLKIMGVIATLIASVMYLYKMNPFRTIDFHPAIVSEMLLGIGVPHYIAYFLIFYGGGLMYVFIEKDRRQFRWVGVFLLLFMFLNAIFLSSVKIAHIVLFAFLIFLLIVSFGRRRKVLILLGSFFLIFAFNFYMMPIKNSLLSIRYKTKKYVTMLASKVVLRSGNISNSLVMLSEKIYIPPSHAVVAPSLLSTVPLKLLPPLAPVVAPTPLSPASQFIDIYSGESRVRSRWIGTQLDDSLKIRQRGIAVGLLMGASAPLMGVGVGQTPYVFDFFTDRVRTRARTLDPFSWQHKIFVDEEVYAQRPDRGIFNIFINAWAETGMFGLIAIIGIILVIFLKGAQALLHTRAIDNLPPIRIFFPLFCAMILYHQTIYLWVHPWLWTMFALTYVAGTFGARDTYTNREHLNL